MWTTDPFRPLVGKVRLGVKGGRVWEACLESKERICHSSSLSYISTMEIMPRRWLSLATCAPPSNHIFLRLRTMLVWDILMWFRGPTSEQVTLLGAPLALVLVFFIGNWGLNHHLFLPSPLGICEWVSLGGWMGFRTSTTLAPRLTLEHTIGCHGLATPTSTHR